MTGRFSKHNSHPAERGAALAIALTLIAAVTLLASAAMRDVTIESAMTRQFSLRSAARLAAFSALESAQAEQAFPDHGEIRRVYQANSDANFESQVWIRLIGETMSTSNDDVFRHYELTVEVSGPGNVRHRRQLHTRVAADLN